MANGYVVFFNDTGGYGYIATDSDEVDGDEDVFFYMGGFGGPDLEPGQEVTFDLEVSPGGPRAWNVRTPTDRTPTDDRRSSKAVC